jgi:hypothetical protein
MAFSALALGLVLALACAALVVYAGTQSGQDWTNGDFVGEDLRLFDSGKYVASARCDVCSETSRGSWSRESEIITLHPFDPTHSIRRFRYTEPGICRLLVPVSGSDATGPFRSPQPFHESGKSCQDAR